MNRLRTTLTAILLFTTLALVRSTAANKELEAPTLGGVLAVNLLDYGAVPDDAKDDTAAINKALKACTRGKAKTLHVSTGTFNISNVTFPKGINVVMPCGALLDIQEKATVRFDGPFSAGLYRVFSNSGNVHFGNAAVQEVFPQWWPSPGGDDSIAIKKAVDSAPDLLGITIRLIGTFHCRTPIVINRSRAHLLGTGQYATQIIFDPAADAALFEFKADNKKVIAQCAIRDMALTGGPKNPHQKVGIRIVDADIIEVRNIAMLGWTGKQSIGLQIRGREFGFIENISIQADLPISIEKDPNIRWISIDHFTFRNTYLLVEDKNNPAVKIDSGVVLTNVVFEGTNSWTTGKYGIYWKDTQSNGTSLNLAVRNVRMEQGTARGGHIIHLEHNYALQNLILENIYGCSGGPGGIYLRRCSNVTLQNIFFTSEVKNPEPAALDIDESCDRVVLINAFWNTGNVRTGKLLKTFGTGQIFQSRNRTIEVYDRPRENTHPIEGIVIGGTRTWSHSGKLANGKALRLPVGAGLGTKVATITVSASDGERMNESGQFMVGARGKTVLVAGTKHLQAKTVDDNLCLVSGNQVKLINHLGADVDVVVTVSWK